MAALVDAGIDVNVLCKTGEAPLHRSARLGWVRKQQAHSRHIALPAFRLCQPLLSLAHEARIPLDCYMLHRNAVVAAGLRGGAGEAGRGHKVAQSALSHCPRYCGTLRREDEFESAHSYPQEGNDKWASSCSAKFVVPDQQCSLSLSGHMVWFVAQILTLDPQQRTLILYHDDCLGHATPDYHQVRTTTSTPCSFNQLRLKPRRHFGPLTTGPSDLMLPYRKRQGGSQQLCRSCRMHAYLRSTSWKFRLTFRKHRSSCLLRLTQKSTQQ
eukprot:COSAG02_NODE_6091_length_3809_cov_10.668733_2_plen_269_part_00